MAASDILSQDEIDALLNGVSSGEVESETDQPVEHRVGIPRSRGVVLSDHSLERHHLDHCRAA